MKVSVKLGLVKLRVEHYPSLTAPWGYTDAESLASSQRLAKISIGVGVVESAGLGINVVQGEAADEELGGGRGGGSGGDSSKADGGESLGQHGESK